MILTKTFALTIVICLAVFASAQRRPRGRGQNPETQALKQQIKNQIIADRAKQEGVVLPPNAPNPSQALAEAIRKKKLEDMAGTTTTTSSTSTTSTTTPATTTTTSTTTPASTTTDSTTTDSTTTDSTTTDSTTTDSSTSSSSSSTSTSSSTTSTTPASA
ncbi:uncharacterized protein LOC120422483 [Culex pipiens pallens]|uniref:uncharacterized protein LOC120422483 n=1 Tax=Culex pipiens pallens TaxID=42434 RepID=UPI00195470F7|nr:uncharacterized protein LOC120422483 [Culex pipiens pallens]